MGCKSECCGRCLLACDGKGILPPCLFITAPELWARSDYFGLLSFEDAAKEQVILNTNPDFFFTGIEKRVFPPGNCDWQWDVWWLYRPKVRFVISPGEAPCILTWLCLPSLPHPTFSPAGVSWEQFLIGDCGFAKLCSGAEMYTHTQTILLR